MMINILQVIVNFLFINTAPLIGPKKIKELSIHDVIHSYTNMRIYSPLTHGSKPVIIYYHGGGWIFGNINAYDRILRLLTYKSDCVVIGVDYKKSPKYKFPTAVNESFAAYKWAIDNIHNYGGDAKRIILAGDSAGGNLAIMTHLKINEYKLVMPKLLLLFYPVIEISELALSSIRKEGGVVNMLGYLFLKSIVKNYTEKNEYPAFSEFVPSSTTLTFPPTLLITAGVDPLNSQIALFKDKLSQENNSVTLKHYKGTIHGFINFAGVNKTALKALNFAIKFINSTLSSR